MTVGVPEDRLIDLDLHVASAGHITYRHDRVADASLRPHRHGHRDLRSCASRARAFVGEPGFYIGRPGFWHGACGPASCWAGGALGLVEFAGRQRRNDPHTLAHLGAMRADAWALQAYLTEAGHQIDAARPPTTAKPSSRALTVRHLVEQASTDILRRLTRAFGPYPLAFDAEITRRYNELDLYLRQSHAERDLEDLARS